MSQQLVIGNTTYTLPLQGDNPAWGDELSDIIIALAIVANNSVGTGDIANTQFSIANNIVSPLAITGLLFDQSTVRSSEIQYSINLSTNTTELVENGKLFLNYDNLTNSWQQTQFSNGFTGCVFSVINGQVYITSPNLTGTSYQGLMNFSARAFVQ